jgi:hypothetical protein
MAAAFTTTYLALYLGLYATAVSTAVGLLTLYGELFQRVSVIAREGFQVLFSETYSKATGRGSFVAASEEALEAMDAKPEDAYPVITVAIRNRGRLPVQIQTIGRAHWVKRDLFPDLLLQVPFEVDGGHTRSLTVNLPEDYARGTESLRRFFAVDGAGRVHPLRERWRQRIENLLYRRAVLWLRRGRADSSHSASREDPSDQPHPSP